MGKYLQEEREEDEECQGRSRGEMERVREKGSKQ